MSIRIRVETEKIRLHKQILDENTTKTQKEALDIPTVTNVIPIHAQEDYHHQKKGKCESRILIRDLGCIFV